MGENYKDDQVTPEIIALFKAKELDSNGCFKCIAAAIEQGFTNYNKRLYIGKYKLEPISRLYERRKVFLEFLKSKVVQAWCDCSDNFEQKRLIDNYVRYGDKN